MKIVFAVLLVLQFVQRPPLAPAETLLGPLILRAINDQPPAAVEYFETLSGAKVIALK